MDLGSDVSNRLDEHKRAVHEGVKYPCLQCGKQFSQRGNLAKHKRAVHEGVKFSCDQCNYQSTQKVNLTRHRRAVHEAVTEKIKEHEKVKKKQKRFKPLLKSGALSQILTINRQ